jgi:hypothetical protein
MVGRMVGRVVGVRTVTRSLHSDGDTGSKTNVPSGERCGETKTTKEELQVGEGRVREEDGCDQDGGEAKT